MKNSQRQDECKYAAVALLLCMTFWAITSCKSHKSILANKAICYYDTTIAKEEMLFDVTKYESVLTQEGISIPNRNDYFNSNSIYRLHHNQVIISEQINKTTAVTKFTIYTPEGNLKSSSFSYGDVELGKSIFYDRQGIAIKIVNHDKGYKICWAQALEIAKKHARRDLARDSLRFISLSRKKWDDMPDFKPQWTVTIATANNRPAPNFKKKQKVYVLDGITGKLIRTYILKSFPF